MKLRKFLCSAAAAAVAVTALSVSASANLTVSENPTIITAGSDPALFKCYLYSGELDIKPSFALSDIASVTFIVTADDPEMLIGDLSGSIAVSCGPADATEADHNWIQRDFYGIIDEDLDINCIDANKPIQSVKVEDYTYSLTCPITAENCFYDAVVDLPSGYAAICLQEWGADLSPYTVKSVELFDADGNTLVKYDTDGNLIGGDVAPATDTSAPATDAAAPADDKGNADTGIEGVGVVTAAAIIAAGAVIVSKKRR